MEALVAPGTRIADRYVVTGDVGVGGMGVVVRARDEKLGRTVAVKVLPKDALGDDTARRRLVREARAAASLDHRGIVHVYDVGETDEGAAYFVMELVKGESLATHLRNGTLSRGERLAAVVEVARALGYAHAQGFVHRDIKPDNIMIRPDKSAVILDFGLAKSFASDLAATAQGDALTVTAKGGFVGTPAYVSPEQARGEAVDPKTDQFALAVTAFELLSGRLPWEGTTPLEVVSEILKGAPASLRDSSKDLPEELDHALAKALAKKGADRYATIDELADALAVFLPELGAQTVSARRLPQSSGTAKSDSSSPATISATKVSGKDKPIEISATKISTTQKASADRRLTIALVVGGVIAAAIAARIVTTKIAGPPVPVPSASAVAMIPSGDAWILACPQLEVHDEHKPSEWLGAAAATLLCGREQIVLGGRSTRTLIAAELLDVPREPNDHFPHTPFEGDARVRAVAAARVRADVWIDGTLDADTDFHLAITLRNKQSVEIARADARAATLVDVVRAVSNQLRATIPPAHDQSWLQKTMAGATIDAALDANDLEAFILEEDNASARDQCTRITARNDLGILDPLVRTICAERLMQPIPALVGDESTPFTLAVTAVTISRLTNDPRKATQLDRAARLEKAATDESDLDARSLLDATAAEVMYYASQDAARAAALARASVQASPKQVDLRATNWHRLSFATISGPGDAIYAHAAWLPWETFAEANLEGNALDGVRTASSLEYFRRASVLARRGYWARSYGESLVEYNQLDSARGVAVQTHSEYLNALIMHGDLRLGAAVDYVKAYVDKTKATNESASEAPLVVRLGVQIAVEIGRPTDFADTFLENFVYAQPPVLTHGAVPLYTTLDLCLLLPRASSQRCVARLNELYETAYFGAALPATREFLRGARAYVNGDYTNAAKAWRQVTSRWKSSLDISRTPLVDAFERSGEGDLASRVDHSSIEENNFLPSTDACWFREAVRAEKRGDKENARSLARAYIDRWDAADERPLHVADAKKLLARVR